LQTVSTQPLVTHQQPTHLWDYWGIVMKRLWLVLLFVVVSIGGAWVVTRNQERQYRSSAMVELVPPAVSGTEMLFAPGIFTDDRYLDTQVFKMKSRDTIEKAVRAQKLSQLREFKGKSDGEIVQMALGKVEVTVPRNKFIMEVAVVGPDPGVLPLLANALVTEFREMQQSEARLRRETTRTDLVGRIAKQDQVITGAQLDKKIQLEAKNFAEATFGFIFEQETDRLGEYTKDRDEVSRWLSRNRVVAEAFRKSKREGTPLENLAQLPEVKQNPQVATLQRQIDTLNDRRRQKLEDGLGASNLQVKALDQEIEQVTAGRNRAVEDVVAAILLSYEAKEQEMIDLDLALSVIEARVRELVQLKGIVDEKNLAIERAKEEKELLNKRLEPIEASIVDWRDLVSIAQTARVPTEPFSPNTSANLTLGAILGVLGGVSLAFLLDYLDDTIRTKDELAKVADVPLLGIVPYISGSGDPSKRDLFAHQQPKSTISEAYRGVRTALTLSAQGPMQKALLLTSAGPREGKSTTAINLATVLAYSGARTLLVDADLRKPRVHKSFGLPNTRGLTNLIIGHDDPATCCVPTRVDRVDLLPSGPIPPNPSELLGHPRMREILRLLRERYDHIIIDTPPIGAVTDAAVLATMADGVILVVHAGKTRRQIVQRGLEQLRYINARIVGVILNNLRMGRIRYYPGYYHYYYYYSSQYGAEEAPPEEKPAAAGKKPPAGDGKA
jgi:capsular exopolysaccharide synthesis family protein